QIGAITLLGLCLLQMGRADEALARFQEGLASESIRPSEAVALRYEIGRAYEEIGQWGDAFLFYQKAHAMQAGFRDVAERLAAMEAKGGAQATEEASDLDELLEDPTPGASQGKISYL